MGLDAYVVCRCWEEGRASAPPIPVRMGVEGIEPAENDVSLAKLMEADQWKISACEHEDMDYAAAHIGNWPWVRMFQDALANLDPRTYATLSGVIPTANGGTVSAEVAATCLTQLDQFVLEGAVLEQQLLRDEATGEVINAAVGRYGGVFLFSGRDHVWAGIDRDGLFFIENDSGARIFDATRFEQVMDLSEPAEPRATLISDRGHTYVGTVVFDLERRDGAERVYAASCRTDVRWLGAEAFIPLVEGLRTVFRAAVEIRRPVCWT